MKLNEQGCRDALGTLAGAAKRVSIMEREAIAETEAAENKLNTARSLLGHIAQFQQEYRDRLAELAEQKEQGQ
jgi:hypothetical protein